MSTHRRSRSRQRWSLLLGATVLAILGRLVVPTGLLSQVPAPPPTASAQAPVAGVPTGDSDYSRRVVAYVRGVAITREDLGEYLIAREGAEKLELLVNKKIIEMYCKDKGIVVTEAEVDAALAQDIQGIGVNLNDFITKVLKRYNKTLYEWKEDVVKPRLALNKLCRERVHVTEKDLQDAFDCKYGESVDCRIILFPKDQKRQAMEVYGKVRESEEEFNRAARTQASSQLAATGGHVRPITRHSTGNDNLEHEAFSLNPGECSALLETPEGYVIVKCDKRTPPDATKKLDDVRTELTQVVMEKKMEAEIPKFFKEIREQAAPTMILKKSNREDDLLRDVAKELASDPFKGKTGKSSNGN